MVNNKYIFLGYGKNKYLNILLFTYIYFSLIFGYFELWIKCNSNYNNIITT